MYIDLVGVPYITELLAMDHMLERQPDMPESQHNSWIALLPTLTLHTRQVIFTSGFSRDYLRRLSSAGPPPNDVATINDAIVLLSSGPHKTSFWVFL